MPSVTALKKASQFLLHSRVGWLIIYGNSNKVQALAAHVVTQALRLRYRRFKTREEGLVFLQSLDDSLPDLIEASKKLLQQ